MRRSLYAYVGAYQCLLSKVWIPLAHVPVSGPCQFSGYELAQSQPDTAGYLMLVRARKGII